MTTGRINQVALRMMMTIINQFALAGTGHHRPSAVKPPTLAVRHSQRPSRSATHFCDRNDETRNRPPARSSQSANMPPKLPQSRQQPLEQPARQRNGRLPGERIRPQNRKPPTTAAPTQTNTIGTSAQANNRRQQKRDARNRCGSRNTDTEHATPPRRTQKAAQSAHNTDNNKSCRPSLQNFSIITLIHRQRTAQHKSDAKLHNNAPPQKRRACETPHRARQRSKRNFKSAGNNLLKRIERSPSPFSDATVNRPYGKQTPVHKRNQPTHGSGQKPKFMHDQRKPQIPSHA